MTRVLVVGEALVDVVDGRDHPGGSAANVAVALARLGRDVELATSWGRDERGDLLARHVTEAGVRLAADPHVLDHTSAAIATLAEDGSASYVFDLAWALPKVTSTAYDVVHVCSLGALLEPGASDVRALVERLRPTATVVYDVNLRPAVTGTGPEVREAVEAMARLADVVKGSDEDLAGLYPDRTLDEAAAALLALGATGVAVTCGAAGARWYDAHRQVGVEAVPVEVADTIGAGDTFDAGLIDALAGLGVLGGRLGALDTDHVTTALTWAVKAAAVTVSRPGADPPWRRELT